MRRLGPWLLPALMMAVITPFTPALDMSVARFFFRATPIEEEGFLTHGVLDFLFAFGIFPSLGPFVLIGSAIGIALLFLPKAHWKTALLVLLATLIIGPVIITNGLLKNGWSRPRPKQIAEFGGPYEYHAYYHPNLMHQGEPLKGFPCGHCTMGFYFLALYHLGVRFGNRRLQMAGLYLAVIAGAALGTGRLAQGAHFVSDVLVSLLIMWWVPMLCLWVERMD